jgi:hypothetical protein
MEKNCKIVFVVGHANWGKSKTLAALTEDNTHRRWWKIAGEEFFIRRMSNDDFPEGYAEFMESLAPTSKPFVIAAFCPNFGDDRRQETEDTLRELQGKGYVLFFWVIEHQYGTSMTVTADTVTRLRTFGTTEVFTERAEPDRRAENLRRFIVDVVLG